MSKDVCKPRVSADVQAIHYFMETQRPPVFCFIVVKVVPLFITLLQNLLKLLRRCSLT